MRILVALCLVAVAAANVEVSTNYHEEIGIPLATRIMEEEHKIISGGSSSKIVGGAMAPPNAHPYLVGLIISFWNNAGTSACGSVLISSNRLVTAAHCYDIGNLFVREYTAVLGSQFLFSGGTRVVTNQIVLHPQWNAAFLENDVAVIYLPSHISFTDAIQPVALPQNNLWDTFEGELAVASGYGRTSDSQAGISINAFVSQVTLRVISEAQCRAVFGANFVKSSTLCTDGFGGVGICGGDSGGPLVINRNGQNILVGISSFVAQVGCQLGHPSAFARVTSFYNFILQNMW